MKTETITCPVAKYCEWKLNVNSKARYEPQIKALIDNHRIDHQIVGVTYLIEGYEIDISTGEPIDDNDRQ